MNGMCLVSKNYTDYEIKNKNSYENKGKQTNKKQRVGIYNMSLNYLSDIHRLSLLLKDNGAI